MKDQEGVVGIQVGGSFDEGKVRREIGELIGENGWKDGGGRSDGKASSGP